MSGSALEPLTWDSAFFGRGVARLRASLDAWGFEQLRAAMQARQLGVVYWLVAPDDHLSQATARAHGLPLLDRKATFALDLLTTPAPPPAGEVAVRLTQQASPALHYLARQSGRYSRFRLDEKLPAGAFEQLYAAWLENALRSERGEVVLTTGAPGHETGLLTLAPTADSAALIGLLAVEEACRRRGLGRALLRAARQQALAWGARELRVVTQLANEPACALYRSGGFGLRGVELVYHVWL
ncbi:GNAT family N-acetyltransferase [Hymenobacter sp. B81]|uniref:GNAT family N-acetyltransferase n=1 Tax=Hymenobacter sp. B81 TaxID=3344878 RepID=UPI0037DDDC6F